MAGYQNDPGTVQQEAGFGFNGRYWNESYTDNLTAAAAGTQVAATQLPSMFNRIATAAAGSSVQLPPSTPGLTVCVINAGANPVTVFAQNGSTDTINTIAGSTGVVQMQSSICYYSCITAGTWFAQGLGAGYYTGNGGSFSTVSSQALTASTTHSQSTPALVTADTVGLTVNNAADSCKLPPAIPGAQITIVNLSASLAAQVYATGSDTINGTAGSTGVVQAAAAVTLYYCVVAGAWVTK